MHAACDSADAGTAPRGHSLLARYLLPVGLTQAPRGDVFARAAVERDNLQRLRRCLPHYAKVHAVIGGAALAACVGCTDCLSPGLGAALLGAIGGIEFTLGLAFASAALALRL